MMVYVAARFKPKKRAKSKGVVQTKYTKASSPRTWAPTYKAEEPKLPSIPFTGGACPKKESPMYTGTYVKGIATTHKSNMIPVTDDQQAKDIARMRRG